MAKLSGFWGAALIWTVVWLWDDEQRVFPQVPRETITKWYQRHPYFALIVWSIVWSHMVRNRPEKVMILW